MNKQILKRLSGFGALVFLIQGISALSGLILTRALSVEEYALFTIVAAMVSSANTLASGGLLQFFNASIGRTWDDKGKVRAIVSVSRSLQLRLAFGIFPFIAGISIFLLTRAGAGPTEVGALCVLILLLWACDQVVRIDVQLLNFDGQQRYAQIADTLVAAARLSFVLLLFYMGVEAALMYIVSYGIANSLKIAAVRRHADEILKNTQSKESDQTKAGMISYVKRQIVNDVFICAQPQIVLVIIAIFGAAQQTAEVGAMSRLGQLYTPIMLGFSAFAVPYFSKQSRNLLRTFAILSCAALIPSMILYVWSVVFPGQLLWLLGDKYLHLENEVSLYCLSVAIAGTSAAMWQLLLNRGYNNAAWTNIPASIIAHVFSVMFFDISSLEGILKMQVVTSLSVLVPICCEGILLRLRSAKL